MKKIILVLLALLMLTALVSCNDQADIPADTTTVPPEDTTTAAPEPEPLKIVDNGTTKFKVIYPDGPDKDMFTAMRNMIDDIEKKTGVKLEFDNDFLKYDETHDDEAYEILVGATNYDQTAEVLADLKTCDYAIVQKGNKIVIAAHTPEMTIRALNYFRKNILPDNVETSEGGKATFTFKEFIYIVDAPITSFTVEGKDLRGFTIVYAKSKPGYDRAAQRLQQDISERYGYLLPIVADTKSEPVADEILIGPTNRAESSAFTAKHEFPNLTYHIGVEGGKFIIAGAPYSCLQGANRFCTTYLYSSGKQVALKTGDHLTDSLIDTASVPLTEGSDIRIMTANILAEFKSWSNTYEITPVYERIEIFAALMEVYRPDVIGIQEVTPAWHEMIPIYLGDTYELIYSKTPDGLVNYSTILYDKTKYDLVDSGVTYFTTEGKNNIRLVTWGVFSSKTSDIKFSVFNSHWCWDTEEHNRQQALEESQLIKKVTEKYPYPYFCTADYNTKQDSANYKYFMELTGAVDAKYVAKDAGTLLNVAGGCANLGEARPSGGNSIDHIFMTPECKVLAFATVLDNAIQDLSDHSPKYADIKLP